jgi:HK97 gp10 family phage protein
MSDLQHVAGLRELNRALEEFPAKFQANVLRGALRAGAKVQLAEARRLVPVAPPNDRNRRLHGGYEGALRDSLRVGTSIKGSEVKAKVTAGGNRKGADTYYASWVEKGTRPHEIKAPGRRSLFFAGLLRKVVQHPGAKPKPFMGPALARTVPGVLQAVAQYIRNRLAKAGVQVPGP